jgi:hypothetical protein
VHAAGGKIIAVGEGLVVPPGTPVSAYRTLGYKLITEC